MDALRVLLSNTTKAFHLFSHRKPDIPLGRKNGFHRIIQHRGKPRESVTKYKMCELQSERLQGSLLFCMMTYAVMTKASLKGSS